MVETALFPDGQAGMMFQQNDGIRYHLYPAGLIQILL